MVRFGRKSSYRLGRRLRSGAKARLDYITYLQTGGDGKGGAVPIPPGQMAATISGGGSLTASLLVSVGVQAVISGGGLMGAHLGVLRSVAATIDAGGELTANLAIVQKLSATIDGGGEMFAHLFPPHRVEGTIDGGGEFTASILVENRLKAEISGGGALTANLNVSIGLGGTIDGGGIVTADAVIAVPLAATISGGGAVEGDVLVNGGAITLSATIGGEGGMRVAVNPWIDAAQAVIDAMVPTPDSTRQTAIRAIVKDLYDTDAWRRLDTFYMLYAHSAQAARLNWKNPTGATNLVEVGTPTFTANDSYAGASGANGLRVDSAGWDKFKVADASMFLYTNDQAVVAANDIGRSPTPVWRGGAQSTAGFFAFYMGTVHGSNSTLNMAMGLLGANRVGITRTMYQNGVAGNVNSTAGGADALDMGVCGAAGATGVFNGSSRKLQAAMWGSSLTPTQQTAIKAAIERLVPPVTVSSGFTALIVAGGGGGGSGGGGSGVNYAHAGGGGAGRVINITTPFDLASGTYPVVVGNGGAAGSGAGAATNGGNSSFNGQTALGGGIGSQYNGAASSGGSGGGGRGYTASFASTSGAAGTGTDGQGNTGGAGGATGPNAGAGGGGGGAGGAGGAGAGNGGARGAAGPGITSSINGTSTVYGQGGLGATADTGNGAAGTTNRGFGGGGGSASAYNPGGAGGSGVVIIRYPGAARGTGGTITTVGSDTVHTFTASGNLVIT